MSQQRLRGSCLRGLSRSSPFTQPPVTNVTIVPGAVALAGKKSKTVYVCYAPNTAP